MKIKNIFAFASVAMALTACNNSDEAFVNSNFPEDGIIRVTTNVDTPTSRAGVDDSNLTSFYMDLKHENDANYSYFVQMRKESGVWNSYEGETPKQMLWKNNKTAINVTAAYLQDHVFTQAELQGTVDLSVAADQLTTSTVEANDLVAMKQTEINPTIVDENLSGGKIKVTLGHVLAKLNVEVTLGTEFNEETNGTTNNPISVITINGTKLKYNYKGSDATITLPETGNDAADVKPGNGTYTAGSGTTKAIANYECILVPQEVAANGFSVTMVINGKTYKWTSDAKVTMEQGNAYKLELTAGKETLVAKGLSAAAWDTETTGGNIGTEYAPINFKSVYTADDYKTWSEDNCKNAPTYEDMCKYLGAGVYWENDDAGEGKQTYTVNNVEHHAGLWVKKMSCIGNDVTSTTSAVPESGRPSDIGDYFFLPAAGIYRNGYFSDAGSRCYVWSSTPVDSNFAYGLYFRDGSVDVGSYPREVGSLPMVAE